MQEWQGRLHATHMGLHIVMATGEQQGSLTMWLAHWLVGLLSVVLVMAHVSSKVVSLHYCWSWLADCCFGRVVQPCVADSVKLPQGIETEVMITLDTPSHCQSGHFGQ